MAFFKKTLASLAVGLSLLLPQLLGCCDGEQVPDDKQIINRAARIQTAGGYKADDWKIATLNPGDVVYGGIPGQTEFYTTKQTVDASEQSATRLFQSLQVKPHPTFGYRMKMQQYAVQKKITVPFGVARANPKFGPGGGDQYFISDFKDVLKPGPITDLKK